MQYHIIAWDSQDQPNLAELTEQIRAGYTCAHQVDTGETAYALVLTAVNVGQHVAQAIYDMAQETPDTPDAPDSNDDPGITAAAFGRKLRATRVYRNMTQVELAHRVGLTGPQLSRIENGYTMPRVDLAAKMADALNVRLEQLL